MLPVTVLDALTFGTFSSLMNFLSVFILGTFTAFSNLVSDTMSATMTLVSNLFITFVLKPADTAIKSVQILWSTCAIAIPRIFSQIAASPPSTSPSLSKLLFNSLPSVPECQDGTVNGYPCAIAYISALAQKTIRFLNLSLPPESAIPLSILELFSWLSRPINDTGNTRADSIMDICARKCAISRSHYTAPLLEIGYLMAACTGLYDLAISGADLPALVVMTLAIWWLKPAFNKRILSEVNIPGPLRGLVAQIQSHKELCRIGSEQSQEIKILSADLAIARVSEKLKDATIETLRAQVLGLGHSTNQSSNQNCNTNQKTKELQAQISRLNTSLHAANTMTTTLIEKADTLERDLDLTRQQYKEAQFDIELLKCTLVANDTAQSSTFTVPFVLVLVDGDAYKWSATHFIKSQHPPGAKAAQAIKDEVRTYIVNNKAQIPLQSRILVRVFQNISEGDAATIRGHRSTRKYTDEFSKDFTESMPLFDYIDCGSGKERADSKIQELVHLFIANPACHTIFLATATDNGFARLLEQYSCDDTVRNKIVLVHPGYIIREIDALGFKSVEWLSVFQREYMPVGSREKAASMARKAESRRNEAETEMTKFIFEKTWGRLGEFRKLERGSSSGLVRKIEAGEISRAAVGVLVAGDGEVPEID